MAAETSQVAPPPPPSKETFHIINQPQDSINEALTGLTQQYPYLSYNPTHKIISRADLSTFRESHVTTIACCGGGHEPMFTGFVGPSFLSAAVSGAVFASPTARQIFEAIKLCQPPVSSSSSPERPGTLLVVGNYTGDILNAGLAITRAEAAGYKVRFVPVGDDVAVGRKKGGKVGRRGLSGHLIALKIACGIAEQGGHLEEAVKATEMIRDNVGTIGVAFDRVALPNALVTDLPLLPADTIELGMGAHGEPGLERISPVPPLPSLIKRMISLLVSTEDSDRSFVPFENGDEIVLLVNSLGSTGDNVLARFAELAVEELENEWGYKVKRVTLGGFVTSLKMSGVGITVWRLSSKDEVMGKEEALKEWDRRVKCVGWRQ